MAINPHHTVEEINGIRCSVIEKKITTERAAYLKAILEFNKMEVVIQSDGDGVFTLGVTNVIFNPIHALYGRVLKNLDGKLVTPAIWYQKEQTGAFYFDYKA